MRQIRYAVAMSLAGYIAEPNGEYDWIGLAPADAADYFRRFYAQFDTALVGRKSFDQFPNAAGGLETYVFSRSLQPGVRRGVTFLSADAQNRVRQLRERPGKERHVNLVLRLTHYDLPGYLGLVYDVVQARGG